MLPKPSRGTPSADGGWTAGLAAAGERPKVEIKSDASDVTETDREIEAALRVLIEARYPDHGILGEEHGGRDLDAEFVWVLDPIDGTAPFIAGIPVYGTLIGPARRGAPWTGVIDHPASRDRWLGVAGTYATFNERPVRACARLAEAFLTNSNPDFFDPDEREAFARLRAQVRYTQNGGTSCAAISVSESFVGFSRSPSATAFTGSCNCRVRIYTLGLQLGGGRIAGIEGSRSTVVEASRRQYFSGGLLAPAGRRGDRGNARIA